MKRILLALRYRIKSLTQTKGERRHAMVGPPSLWEMKRDFQIQFLKAMNLMPEHYLLDIGCGTLRGGIPVIAYLRESHYVGIELRTKVLDEGRKELQEAGLEGKKPTLMVSADISRLMIDQTFDYVWAFSVLIHMSDEILNDTLGFVRKHLSREGVFYANVNIGENEEHMWQGFPVVWRTLEFYRNACAVNGLAVAELGPLKDHGHVSNRESDEGQRMLRITKSYIRSSR